MVKRGPLVVLVLALVVVMAGLADAQDEPMDLTGRWVGTGWVGKYEAPVELTLVQGGERLEGVIALAADPRASAPVPVAGAVEGRRATVSWVVPGTTPFVAELTLGPSGVLFGVGGDVHGLSTGFTLWRVP